MSSETHHIIPSEHLFPATAQSLIAQSKVFTGKEIVMDPHWRAASTMWNYGKAKDGYLERLEEIKSGSIEGFVFYQEGIGAYIVYADRKQRWDGSLASGVPEHDEKAETLCHEIGHLLAETSAGVPASEKRYFDEQCAVTSSIMMRAALGNQYKFNRYFPYLKSMRQNTDSKNQPYEDFCIYTPSPVAHFYQGSGHQEGGRRFMSSTGIVRFDVIADDIVELGPHFHMHLSTMKLFGHMADRLTRDNAYAETVCSAVFGESLAQAKLRSRGQHISPYILGRWWKSLRDKTRRHRIDVMHNMYAGEDIAPLTLDHARGYYLNLSAQLYTLCSICPNDPLVVEAYQGMAQLMSQRTGAIYISKVIARYQDYPSDAPQEPDLQWTRKPGLHTAKAG